MYSEWVVNVLQHGIDCACRSGHVGVPGRTAGSTFHSSGLSLRSAVAATGRHHRAAFHNSEKLQKFFILWKESQFATRLNYEFKTHILLPRVC